MRRIVLGLSLLGIMLAMIGCADTSGMSQSDEKTLEDKLNKPIDSSKLGGGGVKPPGPAVGAGSNAAKHAMQSWNAPK